MSPSLSALVWSLLDLESPEGYGFSVSKRDYGITTSVLLANQAHRHDVELRASKDKNFELAGLLAREASRRARLERFLEEKGLLDQWQCEDE